jgi:thiol-disulfide isomerase/thioredoxin
MRIPLLAAMIAAFLISGCDRQEAGQSQAGDAAAASAGEAEPGRPGLSRAAAGTAAPNVSFLDDQGEQTSLAALRGRPVLVNLWATWCAPCVKELPTLDTLADRPDAPLVLALSQDLAAQDKVRAFLAERNIALDAWHDKEMAFSSELGIRILPTTILYGSDGREIWRFTGDLDWSGPKAAELLKEAR